MPLFRGSQCTKLLSTREITNWPEKTAQINPSRATAVHRVRSRGLSLPGVEGRRLIVSRTQQLASLKSLNGVVSRWVSCLYRIHRPVSSGHALTPTNGVVHRVVIGTLRLYERINKPFFWQWLPLLPLLRRRHKHNNKIRLRRFRLLQYINTTLWLGLR